MKYKLLLITGMSCCGKDTISRYLNEEYDVVKYIPISTRLPREDESEGDPYTFISTEEFEKIKDSLIEYREYTKYNKNNELVSVFYGTPSTEYFHQGQFTKPMSLITTRDAVKAIKEYFGKDNVLHMDVYVTPSDRLDRAKSRSDFNEKEWKRRFESEDADRLRFNSDSDLYPLPDVIFNNTRVMPYNMISETNGQLNIPFDKNPEFVKILKAIGIERYFYESDSGWNT